MRRARIQVKPNIAKAVKKEVQPTEPIPVAVAAVEIPIPVPAVVEEIPNHVEDVVMENLNPSPEDDAPSESMKSLHVDVAKIQNHVHFTDDVIDNEKNRTGVEGKMEAGHQNNVSLSSPNSTIQFAVPHPGRLMTPRSRNVSMCEDESILQLKQPREKKRFTGKEELDTKTWKMSDLTRWNPRNEMTSFKRERRSSTSSTVITKSEIGDFDAPSPRINAPQVKIGADGRLVIDETSLVVQSAQVNHESVWETVEEGRMGSKITSMSFRTRIFRKPNLWSSRETDLFYEVLQCTGQDFGLMHHYLPQRSRPELKAKYNREEKTNWPRILKAISHPVRLDGELEVRIAKIMAEIEEEIQEKKAKSIHDKAEERRKQHAKELVKQAKELEKGARIAAKLSLKITGKAEKAAERIAEKEAKTKEKSDAKQMAMEAKRIAMEARSIIKETRKVEKEKQKEAKVQAESHNLEREAERIIRRLMQESQRDERRAAKERNNSHRDDLDSPTSPKDTASKTLSPPPQSPKNKKTGLDGEDSSSDSSESSSTESSDEEAVTKDTARREKRRMKQEKRNIEPRKTVSEKKPIYVNPQDIKYANVPISDTVAMVQATKGEMFLSADEDDEIPENPLSNVMDTSSPSDGPSTSTQVEVVEASAAGSASSPSVETPDEQKEAEEEKKDKNEEAKEKNEEKEKEDEEEPIPQAVYDVIEEVIKCNKNKKVEEDVKKTTEVGGKEKKKRKIVRKDQKDQKKPKVMDVQKESEEHKDQEEEKKLEEQKKTEEPQDSGESVAKMTKLAEEAPEDNDDMIIDVVGDSDNEKNPQEEPSQPDDTEMDADEIIDVVTVEPGPEIVINEPSTSSLRAAAATLPSSSSTSSTTEVSYIQQSTSSIPSYSLARRTVKRPITWMKKK
uniref:Myb_DNA-bind_7 domain-containing protein n=1 Tax=Caenorhabditis tropicalis TaxID=1561998 RepID=A0A1I7UG35_9PELO